MKTKKLRNPLGSICFDGCMFPTSVMMDQQTWNDILDLSVKVRDALIAAGLPESEAPKRHVALWSRHVGRSDTSKLGKVIPLSTTLDFVIKARGSNGEKFEGVDFIEIADVSVDMPEEEFQELVSLLKANDLGVGDIVACTWPAPESDQGPAWGTDEDRARFVEMVDRACRLRQRFIDAGVEVRGRVRSDSGGDPESFEASTENFERMCETFRQMAEKAASYGTAVVIEGEICWGGQAGYRQCHAFLSTVNHPALMFQADTAHLALFIAAFNVNPSDNLLPENVTVYDPADPELDDDLEVPEGARQATAEELWVGWEKMARLLAPHTGSFHYAQSTGTVFGAGAHDKTGKHRPAKDPKGIVEVARVAVLWLLEAA
jgi:hypothetical protein